MRVNTMLRNGTCYVKISTWDESITDEGTPEEIGLMLLEEAVKILKLDLDKIMEIVNE